MKSSRRLNRRRRERCHLLVLKFYSLSFSVFLRLSASVCLSCGALSPSRSFSLSLSEAFFASRVLSKTPTSLRNLSEKTRAHENDRRHKKVLPFKFALRQTDKKGRKASHTSRHSSEHENDFWNAREERKALHSFSLSLSLSLSVYIYRAHTASSS